METQTTQTLITETAQSASSNRTCRGSASLGDTAPRGAVSPNEAGGLPNTITPPDPEVGEKKPRRRFTAKYKLEIIEKADRCSESGEIGALLRQEGLYSSHLSTWREQKKKGLLNGMSPQKRGRKQNEQNKLNEKIALLERENRQLKHQLKKAEAIIEVQKKISEILNLDLNLVSNEGICS